MKTSEDSVAQSKHGEPGRIPGEVPDEVLGEVTGPPFEPVRHQPRRTLQNGVGAILLIDILALVLVLASGPAAYLWLDSSRPGPLRATATPGTQPRPTPGPSVSPGAGGSPGAGVSPGVGASAAVSAGPSSKPVYGDGTWTRTDPLPQAKWATASVVLRDGRIMVVGGAAGSSSFDAVASTAIFDPATGHWSQMTDMLQARAYAMAVTLADGSVLVAGGSRDGQPLDTAERYYPGVGTWVAAGRINLPRTQGTLTLMGDGRVLAAGGGIEGTPGWSTTASAEIFDPTTGMWTLTAPMSVARGRHTATLLADGEVLVTGGATTYHGETGDVTATTEIYDPRASTWRAASPMSEPRYVHAAVRLSDGRILVAGGWYATSNSDPSHETAEIYDPATDHWTATGSMTNARAEFGLVPLLDGRILALGGVDPSYKVQAGSELYDPATGEWQVTGGLGVAIEWAAVQTLPDGRVLVAGGGLDALASEVTAACQVYTPAPR